MRKSSLPSYAVLLFCNHTHIYPPHPSNLISVFCDGDQSCAYVFTDHSKFMDRFNTSYIILARECCIRAVPSPFLIIPSVFYELIVESHAIIWIVRVSIFRVIHCALVKNLLSYICKVNRSRPCAIWSQGQPIYSLFYNIYVY